jgi:hypothetical protein
MTSTRTAQSRLTTADPMARRAVVLDDAAMDTLAAIVSSPRTRGPEPGGTMRTQGGRLLAGAIVLALIVSGVVLGTRPTTRPPVRSLNAVPAGGVVITQADDFYQALFTRPYRSSRAMAEVFARYHLDITVKFLPASPSMVGVLDFSQETVPGITPIYGSGTTPGGGRPEIGLRIPLDYRGAADFAAGRAARPGETYETTGNYDAPGEALHGHPIVGDTLAQAWAVLGHLHLAVFYAGNTNGAGHPDWYVESVVPRSPTSEFLFVSPTPQSGP